MAGSRFPSDVRLLDWADKDDFYRVRGAWLEWTRWDPGLSATAQVCLAEIGDRMAWDKNGSWPGQDLLAATIGCGDKTVRNAVAKIFERGWLVGRRGGFEERKGWGKSYTYAMAASPSVLRLVIEGHQQRIADMKQDREVAQYRQKIAAMLIDAIPEEKFLSYRQKMTGNSGKFLPVIPAKNDRLIYSENLSSEPIHRTSEERGLSDETVQDEALGGSDRSESDWRAIADAREDLISLFGDGDADQGTRMFAVLGKRATHLAELVAQEGAGALAARILTAKADACRLLEKSTTATRVST